jgi:hypothetical protein
MRRGGCLVAVMLAAVSCAKNHTPSEDVDPRCEAPEPSVWEVGVSGSDSDNPVPARDAPPAAPVGGFCDGSSELRLVVATHGNAFLQVYYWAFELHGEFLVVDGRCHYYVASDQWQGVVEGQLTADTVAELTRDLALNELGELPSTLYDCSDHWQERLIATRDESLRCRCDDCVTAPKSTAAMVQAARWLRRLASVGTPYNGPVHAFAQVREPPEAEPGRREQDVLVWPLSRSLEDFPNLVGTGSSPPGAVFPQPAAAALRKLRQATGEMRLLDEYADTPPLAIFVDDCAQRYELLMYDVLPEALSTELDAFLPMAWKRPKIESCWKFNDTLSQTPCTAE